MAARLKQRYLTFDPRTLGLYRIVFGALLLFDLLRRVPFVVPLYTNDGVLANHYALYHPLARHVFSLFLACSTEGEVYVAFAVTAFVYLCFLAGWHTRLAQIAGFVLLVSLHTRNLFIENGGDVIMCLLMAWTLPLPLGRRFSVDALRADALPDVTPVYSLAAPAILLQVAAIYLLNAIAKDGPAWRDGTAVYYVLHQARLVSGFGVWLRVHAPLGLLKLFTWGTRLTELAAPIILLLFLWQRHLRWLALASLWALHFGLLLSTNLTQFQLTMMSIPILFLDGEDWARLESWLRGARQSAEIGDERRRWRWLGEAWIVLLLVACGSQLLVENPLLVRLVHIDQPKALQAIVDYGRLFQGWKMFAPDAPRDDGVMVIDAVTESGRHVDPQSGEPPRFDAVMPPGGRYPMPQLWCDYTNRIRDRGRAEYRAMFRDYLLRLRVNGEGIRAFEVWWLWRRTPEPGEAATEIVRERVLAYP